MAEEDEWRRVAPHGILPIPGANALFLEPSLMLTSSYSSFSLLPSSYYSRSLFLPSSSLSDACPDPPSSALSDKKKKKKRKRKSYSLNPKEQLAEQRHQDVRPFILNAHRAFMALHGVPSLLRGVEDSVLNRLSVKGSENLGGNISENAEVVDFVKLAHLWQAPFYDISLSSIKRQNGQIDADDEQHRSTSPLFNHMVENGCNEEILAMCAGSTYLLPKKSRLLLSDFTQIQQLLPGDPHDGYNLLLVDPPWENKSVHRRALYPTLPNRYLLSLPIRKLAHPKGALLGLWITNRQKLHAFVEDELFPTWGIVNAVTWYWLKVKSNGGMVSDLDSPHHKPYECLLLGYVPPQMTNAAVCKESSEVSLGVQIPAPKVPPDKQVLISIPGDHSRKPPVGLLLSSYASGPTPVKSLELFARDLNPGWTSWGNEPLRFQQMSYFTPKN